MNSTIKNSLLLILLGALLFIPNILLLFALFGGSEPTSTAAYIHDYIYPCSSLIALSSITFAVKVSREGVMKELQKVHTAILLVILFVALFSLLYFVDLFTLQYNFYYNKADKETLFIGVLPLLIEVYTLILASSYILQGIVQRCIKSRNQKMLSKRSIPIWLIFILILLFTITHLYTSLKL